ncbi:hypothetical protein J6590_017271 [Homalodisca vitripennis]|nr:hypothetical protein J6590_017271 [Homalodisca vitripennis]
MQYPQKNSRKSGSGSEDQSLTGARGQTEDDVSPYRTVRRPAVRSRDVTGNDGLSGSLTGYATVVPVLLLWQHPVDNHTTRMPCSRSPHEVRAKKSSLTQPGDQPFKGDFRTTTNGRAGELLARKGSLSGHPSKQQPRPTLLDLVILR